MSQSKQKNNGGKYKNDDSDSQIMHIESMDYSERDPDFEDEILNMHKSGKLQS